MSIADRRPQKPETIKSIMNTHKKKEGGGKEDHEM